MSMSNWVGDFFRPGSPGGGGATCPAPGPAPDLRGFLADGAACPVCHPDPKPPPWPPVFPPVDPPPVDPPVPWETVEYQAISVSHPATGGSPIEIFYQVSLATLPPGATVFSAVLHYGFVPASGNVVGHNIQDTYGAGFNALVWNRLGIMAINGNIGGHLDILASVDFNCSPASPCTATFGPVLLEVWYVAKFD